MGHRREAALILEGFRERDRSKTLGAFTDEVLHELGIIGDARHCRAEVARYRAAGVDVPVIAAGSSDAAVLDATLEAFAAQAAS
jgi:hypothetical protein